MTTCVVSVILHNMKLYTSSYKISGGDPKAVGISVGLPKGYRGRTYQKLAPTRQMLKIQSEETYTEMFTTHILSRLNPEQVAQELGDGSIMLCWEKPGEFCHRRLVAEWMENALGIVVPELTLISSGPANQLAMF